MGLIDEIDKLELSDDVKARLRAEHEQEVAPLRASNRRQEVESEIQALGALGLSDSPGLMKFVRRIFLSDDAEPGLVMLSDNELSLSGDVATGANGREEISVADAVRKVFELMPKNAEGKLNLSDQGLVTENHGRPDDGEENEESEHAKRRDSASRWSGRDLTKKGGES